METVDVIKYTIDSVLVNKANIKTFGTIGGNKYEISTCKPLWFQLGRKVVVDGVEGIVNEILSDSIIVTFTTAPITQNTITVDKPYYYHGTLVKTLEEMNKGANSKFTAQRTPFIYFKEPYTDKVNIRDSANGQIADINLYILCESDFAKWTTEQHYTNAIKPMKALTANLLDALYKCKYVGQFEGYESTNHVNFGVYVSEKGHLSSLFTDKLSGVEVTVSLPVLKNNCNC